MSFLTPLFLLGALAIAGPILFHLIRRTPRNRVPFSSLRFLEPTPPRITRRSRIEHWLLLLLRCLALALVAFGFARPFLRQPTPPPPPSDPASRTVLLVDTSASMGRPDLFNAARKQVAERLRKADPGEQFALFTFDREVTSRFSFDQWSAAPPHPPRFPRRCFARSRPTLLPFHTPRPRPHPRRRGTLRHPRRQPRYPPPHRRHQRSPGWRPARSPPVLRVAPWHRGHPRSRPPSPTRQRLPPTPR